VFQNKFFFAQNEVHVCKFSLVLLWIQDVNKSLEEVFSHVFYIYSFFCAFFFQWSKTFVNVQFTNFRFLMKLIRCMFLMNFCSFLWLIMLILFIQLPLYAFVNFYKKKVCYFTLHILFNIKFLFLLKSNCVEE
jgi:hypothetical protein